MQWAARPRTVSLPPNDGQVLGTNLNLLNRRVGFGAVVIVKSDNFLQKGGSVEVIEIIRTPQML
jgi:hypothetical protein